MILTTVEQWQEWSSTYTMLPYVIKLGLADDRIASWEDAWKEASPDSFVLESGKGGRYTHFGLHPFSTVRGTGLEAEITSHTNSAMSRVHGKPLDIVKQWMSAYHSPKVQGAPKFVGGCVGYWSYDVIRTIEKLPEQSQDDLPIPDYSFAMYDQVWTLDHTEKSLFIAVHMPFAKGADLSELYAEAHARAEAMLVRWHAIRAGNWSGTPLSGADQPTMAREQLHIDVESIAGIQPAFDKSRVHGCGGAHPSVHLPR